jgi:hypothetical protein
MTKTTKKYKSMDDEEIHISRTEITSLLAGVTTRRSRKHQDKGPRKHPDYYRDKLLFPTGSTSEGTV